MRAAILLAPLPDGANHLPECFGHTIDDGALREWMADPAARERLAAVAPQLRFDHAVGAALGLPEGRGGVAVVYVAGHTWLSDADWSAFGFEDLFEVAARRADDDVEHAIATASKRFDDGAWDIARTAYHDAEERLQHETGPRHAEVLVCLGEIERVEGRSREATALFDRALSLFPLHRGALEGRAAIARSAGEHAIAAAMLHRLVDRAVNDEERIDLLSAIATESLTAAQDAIARALEQRPRDRGLLERLGSVHEAAGRWEDAVTVAVTLAEGVPDRALRARALATAAALCSEKAHNSARAVALYEAAIEDDPTARGAFAAVEAVLVASDDAIGVARAYERQLERLEERGATRERIDLFRKLGRLSRDRLGDTRAAIQALDEVVKLAPDDVEARAELADLLDAAHEPTLAMKCLEIAAEVAPSRADTYRKLHGLFSRASDRDRDYAACAALVALGEADLDEQLVYAQFAPESVLRPERAFDDHVWTALCPEDHDFEIDAVVRAIEPTAIDLWIEARGGDRLSLPPESAHQNPETTTVSATKSFAWASRLLAVPEPRIYALPAETRGGAMHLPSKAPAVALGRTVLTGRAPVELSFIAAHHLSYHRRGWRVLAFYPELSELQGLALAAIAVGAPALASRLPESPELDALRSQLNARLAAADRQTLTEAVGRLMARGAELDLKRWIRSVETAACRAGLLATGDVTVAGNLLAVAGRPVLGLTAAQRARELLGFSVSERHAALRRLLGIAV